VLPEQRPQAVQPELARLLVLPLQVALELQG